MKYADRAGNRWNEESGQDRFLERMYSCAGGRALLKVLTLPAVSKLGGMFLNTRISSLAVGPTVKKNMIYMGQY